MNHISQRNNLEKQCKSYVEFMKNCPRNSVIKLAQEISRIQARVSIIRNMNYQHLQEEVVVYYETKQSKSNFKTV
jgi:hypothetical protein